MIVRPCLILLGVTVVSWALGKSFNYITRNGSLYIILQLWANLFYKNIIGSFQCRSHSKQYLDTCVKSLTTDLSSLFKCNVQKTCNFQNTRALLLILLGFFIVTSTCQTSLFLKTYLLLFFMLETKWYLFPGKTFLCH